MRPTHLTLQAFGSYGERTEISFERTNQNLFLIDLPKPTVIAILSIRASATVTYRVIEAIFFLPSSPSLCISSSAGMAMVRSCIMMDEVI